MDTSNYFWVRIFDYQAERDFRDKGTLLDEFYLKDVEGGREEAKTIVQSRYLSPTATDLKFAKPRKGNGVYAIVMESEKFFYDRFYAMVDTFCFYCHKPVKGKASEFPRDYIGEDKSIFSARSMEFSDIENTAFFCGFDCKHIYNKIKYSPDEGEFQVKEEGKNGEVFGYIYLIYNRAEDTYYIGQTRYLPFFRWQEHIKDGGKGDITDMSFSVLVELRKTRESEKDQQQLNSLEAWWIEKFKAEEKKVFNISKPKITVTDLKQKFQDMVEKQRNLFTFGSIDN